MPTPFQPRENDPQELDRFKQSIDLVEYATRRHGYDVKKAGPRGNWHQLEREGEMLIVSRKGDHQVYLNPGDDRDSGSIIDFVKTREHQTLGQVRQTLRQYLGEPEQGWEAATAPQLPPPAAYAPRPVDPAEAPTGETEEQRRARLVGAVLGAHAALTDRSYLQGRGLSDETIDAPAFQGRVFTSQQGRHHNTAFPLYNEHGIATVEQRGEGYKNLLALPKTGVWVSHPTEGPGTKVERLVVSESPVDAMSYHQLRQREQPASQPLPNTLYVATSGTVTERQVELIQRLIDKQEPREVLLANDNDAAGRRFNINYLNELHPPRQAVELNPGLVAYDEAPRPVAWHATAAGKYHTALRVEFNHGTRAEGAAQLAQLTEQVQGLRAASGEETAVEVQRSTRQQTVARLVVPNADAADLEKLAATLLAQREAQREQPERQPEHFIRTEYAISKDFNRDLELLNQGLTPQQVTEQARADEQAKEAQRLAGARQQQLERQQAAEATEAQRQREAQPATDPDAQRAQTEQRQTAAVLAVAAADPALRRQLLLTVTEPTPTSEASTHAQQMHELLRKAGAEVQQRPAEAGPTEPGQLRTELAVQYHMQPPTSHLRQLSQTLDALEKSPLVTVTEDPAQQAERRQLAAAPPAATKTATIRIDEPEPAAGSPGRAEAVAEQLRAAGLNTGSLRSSTDEATHQRHSEIQVSYRLDQPELPRISAALDAAARQPGVQVAEHAADRTERQQQVGVASARGPVERPDGMER